MRERKREKKENGKKTGKGSHELSLIEMMMMLRPRRKRLTRQISIKAMVRHLSFSFIQTRQRKTSLIFEKKTRRKTFQTLKIDTLFVIKIILDQ